MSIGDLKAFFDSFSFSNSRFRISILTIQVRRVAIAVGDVSPLSSRSQTAVIHVPVTPFGAAPIGDDKR